MRLNERISVKTYNRVADEYGGYNNTEAAETFYWCNLKHKSGDIRDVDGKRDINLYIDIIMREKSAESLSVGQTIHYSGQEFRIASKIDSELKYFTKLTAIGL